MIDRTIVEESVKNISIIDVFSKLAQERIIFIDGVINDTLANGVIAQLLYMDSVSHEEIRMYINSAGGSVYDGLAIYDVAKFIKSPIKTVCIGKAFSMGAILMFVGQERCSMRHSTFMLHQPKMGSEGSITEVKIDYEEGLRLRIILENIIKEHTKYQDIDKVFINDTWITPEEALENGLITKIL